MSTLSTTGAISLGLSQTSAVHALLVKSKSFPHTFAETVRDIPVSEHLPPFCPALQHARACNQTFVCAQGKPVSMTIFTDEKQLVGPRDAMKVLAPEMQ